MESVSGLWPKAIGRHAVSLRWGQWTIGVHWDVNPIVKFGLSSDFKTAIVEFEFFQFLNIFSQIYFQQIK